jgi:ABC-type enterochelin transport system substrate-binding protein
MPIKKNTSKTQIKKTPKKITDLDGGFIDTDTISKLSVPFGLLIAKQGLDGFLDKTKKANKSKKTAK